MKKFILVLMLVVIFAIAYSYTAAVRFCDEDDILTASWLISNGYVLYKDIFSHHMPLPYYIMSIPNLFLNPLSFDIFRCFFYIFIGSVFIFFNFYDKNGLRNFWLLIYIIILLLSFPLFNGYWVLADTFFALGALAVFISVLNNQECNFSIKEMIVISSGVAFCILSTLISVYPVLFFLVYYFTIRFIKNDCKYSFQLLKEDAKFIGILSCPFLIWIVYTIFTDGFRDFIQNAYLFNTKYYSLFTGMNTPVTLILNHIQNITDLFKNINFTTVIFYLAFLYFMLKLIIKDKKYNLALFSFIFLYLLRMRGLGFHAVAYYYILIYVFVLVLKDIVLYCKTNFLKLITIIVSVFLVLNMVYIPYIDRNPSIRFKIISDILSRHKSKERADVVMINLLLQKDDKMWQIPLNPAVYYQFQRKPANKNIFYLPWQAIVSGNNDQVVSDLEKNKVKLVFFDKDAVIWGYHVKNYASPIYEYILKNYYTYPKYNYLYFRRDYKEDFDKILKINGYI